MPPFYQNPFSEKKILGPGETDPKADVELARTLLGDEAAEEYAEALVGSTRTETLSEGFTEDEKAVFEKQKQKDKEWEEKNKWEKIPGERFELTIGGKTKEQLLAEMKAKGIEVSGNAQHIIDKITFPEIKEKLNLIKISVSNLGFPKGATTEDVYIKAKELGFELVPPETALYLRLEDTAQRQGEHLFVGMEPITDSYGDSFVFHIYRSDEGLKLGTPFSLPTTRWVADYVFVFRIPDTKK